MEPQDPRLGLVRTVHKMMTQIAKAIQVTPFIYSTIFVVVFIVYNIAGERVLDILDTLFYISPLVMLAFVFYSRILHLCKWHRVTCIIPLIPQVVDWADSFLNLTQYEVIISNSLTIILIILLLISAYKVYGRNRC